ncbi:hypothetical protein D9613_007620 [Agrocybe pediades]|uniref:Uncharacterized protein n=1 Tax=Agrocybe pediades TaxID=84607 RepID=A0A8H4QM79_9AGAR|nr:hypothetical protein D9613_007620 [Agrocybe pediades]
MSLAQRLDQLAAANAQGLLNDDEYRLLRQNVFEQFSTSVTIPVEVPIVPIARVQVPKSSSGQHRRTPAPDPITAQIKPKHPRTPSSVGAEARTKLSLGTNVVNLFRRVTGRKPSNSALREQPHPSPKSAHKAKDSVRLPKETPKRNPSQATKRIIDVPPPLLLKTDTSHINLASPRSQGPPGGSYQIPRSTNTPGKLSSASFYSDKSVPSTSMIQDIFDETNLFTSKDILNAIAATEEEARKLVDAFNNLEESVVRRIKKKNARRLTPTTPTSVNVVMSGQEWREHRLLPSPSSPSFDKRQRYRDTLMSETSFDGVSIRSDSSKSNQTSLSHSKSVSSLPKIVPSSPLSASFRIRTPSAASTPHSRKISVSSVSSQGNQSQYASANTLSPTSSLFRKASLSRSTSRLTLRRQKETLETPSFTNEITFPDITEELELDDADEDDTSELAEIRKRREDVVARCNARLDFLRAKLRGAQLHEKLLKK